MTASLYSVETKWATDRSYYEIIMSALQKMLNSVLHIPQKLVDKIGMYRVVTVSLILLFLISIVASFTKLIYYSPLAMFTSLVIALSVALIVNVLCAKLWRIHANHESAVITALILFFMMIPSAALLKNWQLASAVALAMLSKYVFAWKKQHVANPAATGAVALVLIIGLINLIKGTKYNTDIFSWWVANPILLWPVLALGVLIVSKVRRTPMVLAFMCVGLGVFVVESLKYDPSVWVSAKLYFVSYPTLFLAFFMLTEPFTTPPQKYQQVIYGGLVGALSATSVFSPLFSMTPELALALGNLFAYIFRVKQKVFLKLKSKREVAQNTWEFSFAKPKGFNFKAGQYAEWMLPHPKPDSRGIRRYFTIASSPTEQDVRLAFRVIPEGTTKTGSTFKKAFLNLDENAEVTLSQVAGDFLLPRASENKTKVGMIAGGIGITPFASHLASVCDNKQDYDISLYYCVNNPNELAYHDEFERYSIDMGLNVIPVVSNTNDSEKYEQGYVTEALLKKHTPDVKERTWYLSGPPAMVNNYKQLLRDLGVPRRQIKTDYFPGLA